MGAPSDFRVESTESISSMKMTLGCRQPATANSARTIFSPSPIHLDVREDAEMEKNVALHDKCVHQCASISEIHNRGLPLEQLHCRLCIVKRSMKKLL